MTFKPSEKLRVKFNLWVGLIFLACIFPFVFLGFIPNLGRTYVWIFLAANALWMIPTFALIRIFCAILSPLSRMRALALPRVSGGTFRRKAALVPT